MAEDEEGCCRKRMNVREQGQGRRERAGESRLRGPSPSTIPLRGCLPDSVALRALQVWPPLASDEPKDSLKTEVCFWEQAAATPFLGSPWSHHSLGGHTDTPGLGLYVGTGVGDGSS